MGGEHTFDDIDRAAAALEATVAGVDGHTARRTGGHDTADAYAYDGLITLARHARHHPTPTTTPPARPAAGSQAGGSERNGSERDGSDAGTARSFRNLEPSCDGPRS